MSPGLEGVPAVQPGERGVFPSSPGSRPPHQAAIIFLGAARADVPLVAGFDLGPRGE